MLPVCARQPFQACKGSSLHLLQTLQTFKTGNKEDDDASKSQLVVKPGSLPMLAPPGLRGETAVLCIMAITTAYGTAVMSRLARSTM